MLVERVMREGVRLRPHPGRFLVGCIAVLLLLAGPSASAAGRGFQADLAVQGPVSLHGPVTLRAGDGTAVLVPPPHEGTAAVVDAAQGALRVVTAQRDVVIGPRGETFAMQPEYDVQTVPLREAHVAVLDAREDFLGVVTPTDGLLHAALGEAARALAIEPEARAYGVGTGESFSYYFTHEVPAGSFQLFSQEGLAEVVGDLQLAVSGAVLEVTTPDGLRTFELGERSEPAQAPVPGGAMYREVTRFAVVALEDATLQTGPGAGVVLYSRAPSIDIAGRIAVERASGLLSAPGAAARAVDERLRLDGRFQLQGEHNAPEGVLASGQGETRLRMQGQASAVLIGGVPWALPPDPAEVAAPAALLVAGILAWLTGLGPKALAAAAAPLFATATPESLLANERRRTIYQAVLRTPGVHMRELHRLTGMRWGSLQYHAAVLVGTGVLVATRAGRRTILACDAHGLAPEQVRALHLLRSPRALRVARALASGQVRTQRDIALATGVSFRLVSRYLGVMQSLGLVETTNGNRPKRYATTPRLAELLPHAVVTSAVPAPAPPASTSEAAVGWPPAGH